MNDDFNKNNMNNIFDEDDIFFILQNEQVEDIN